ncbi:hypothetical protein C8R48DRAFT_779115 [Suillus tomentosus]|nr:hypothetical protein C8R48DRAFT_779115 [Suillus tomentosus]
MDTSNSAKKWSMSPSTEARYKESKIGIKRPKLEAPDAEPRRPKREVPDAEPMFPVPHIVKHLAHLCGSDIPAKTHFRALGGRSKDLTLIQASLRRLVSERWDAEVKRCEEAKKVQLLELLLAAHGITRLV